LYFADALVVRAAIPPSGSSLSELAISAGRRSVVGTRSPPRLRDAERAMNRRLRKEDRPDRGPVPGHHHGRATPQGTDDEKDTMRWLASTAAETVG
jgi:hypothetical protein